MKLCTLCFCLLILGFGCRNSAGPDSSQGTWELIRNAGTGYFQALSFADRNNGWAIIFSGDVYRNENM